MIIIIYAVGSCLSPSKIFNAVSLLDVLLSLPLYMVIICAVVSCPVNIVSLLDYYLFQIQLLTSQ